MNNEEKILLLLETLVTTTKGLERDMVFIKEEVSSLKEELSSLKEELSSLKEEVSSLKNDVSSLKNDVNFLKEEVSSLKEEYYSFKQETNARLDNLEKNMQSLTDIVLRIEYDHGKKLDALFDGYTSNYELIERVDPRITKLERAVDKLNFQIEFLRTAR